MKGCWRWYGELDPIPLRDIRQTGATGIVSALHEIPYGAVWDRDRIAARKAQIETAGFTWDVVESLPVSEAIKLGQGDLTEHFANYRQSMANLAAEGVTTICYNFMPLLDWTRTDLNAPVATGGTCLRFDAVHMAAFELFILRRAGAEADYPDTVLRGAQNWAQAASDTDKDALLRVIMTGMPGAFDRYDLEGLRAALSRYAGFGPQDLRSSCARFLSEVIPSADDLGISLCVHPDDPPRDILGLPRIVSNATDIEWILERSDSPAHGLTLCSGSLGAGPDNDVVALAKRHADRIHFAHLRNVTKDPDGSFAEAAHLEGDTDMVALCSALVQAEADRQARTGRDWQMPYRPDHGHRLLTDMASDTIPGYPLIGRLRGLAELRGVFQGLAPSQT